MPSFGLGDCQNVAICGPSDKIKNSAPASVDLNLSDFLFRFLPQLFLDKNR
jgi:hypothetical protein